MPSNVQITRLLRRKDFLAIRSGPRQSRTGFLVQARLRKPCDPSATNAARIGFTITKKLGNAVVRNRIRRRLREAIRTHPGLAICGRCDYVIVARRAAFDMPFDELKSDLASALEKVTSKLRA